jgi:signal transduction histidine kinase
MTALLNWRLWAAVALAAGLAFTHFTAYRAGKANVRAEWTAEKLKQTEQLAAFNAESRRIEQRRQSLILEAQHAAKQREILAAASARDLRTELDGLRDDLARAGAQLSSASIGSLRRRVTALDTVFEQCARRVEGLAGDAQGIASDARLILDAWPK